MKKLTIQQAIFLLSTLAEKERELLNLLYTYKVPLLVNGKDVTEKNQKTEMLENIKNISLIQEDIVTLKIAVNNANLTTKIDEKSISEYLELVRVKRNYLSTLNNLVKGNYSKVENGVGVVHYGILNGDYIKEEIKKLEVEVFEISQKIDTVNGNTWIEVKLVTEDK